MNEHFLEPTTMALIDDVILDAIRGLTLNTFACGDRWMPHLLIKYLIY